MTRDDITPMLNESGIHTNLVHIVRIAKESGLSIPLDHVTEDYFKALTRFASLVAAAEREACAKVCDGLLANPHTGGGWSDAMIEAAAAIRARKDKQ